jgi:hypothetical protein
MRRKLLGEAFVKILKMFLAVLSLVLTMQCQNAAPSVATKASNAQAVQCQSDANTGSGCHANYSAGCGRKKDAKSGKFLPYDPSYQPKYDAYLAYLKNQIPLVLPKSQAVLTRSDFVSKYQQALKFKNKITTDNHAAHSQELLALGEGQYFTIVGYLYYSLINTGGESCNCDLPNNEPAADYHIGIGFDSQLAANVGTTDKQTLEQNSIIVEMTPHYRARYHAGKWTSTLLDSIRGRQVKIVGQLLLDNDHMKASDVCGTPGATAADQKSCWRLSAWELHPVTEFYVCKTNSCTEQSGEWIALDDAPSEGIGKK